MSHRKVKTMAKYQICSQNEFESPKIVLAPLCVFDFELWRSKSGHDSPIFANCRFRILLAFSRMNHDSMNRFNFPFTQLFVLGVLRGVVQKCLTTDINLSWFTNEIVKFGSKFGKENESIHL